MKKYLLLLPLLCMQTVLKAQVDTVNEKINKIPFEHVDVLAKFPQGDFKQYISTSLQTNHKTENSIKGQIILLMVIGDDGKISQTTVLKSLSPQIDPEVVRVINNSPKWQPAKLNGKNVSMDMVLDIDIAINGTPKPVAKPKAPVATTIAPPALTAKTQAAPQPQLIPKITKVTLPPFKKPASVAVAVIKKPEPVITKKVIPPASKKPEPPVVKKPEPVIARKVTPAPIKKPEPPVVKKPEPVIVKKVIPPPVKKPEPPVVKKPEPVIVKKVIPAPVKKPEPPVVKKPEPVIARKVIPPPVKKPEPPVVKKPEPVIVKKVIPPPVKKPEPPVVKKAEPVIAKKVIPAPAKKPIQPVVKKPEPLLAKVPETKPAPPKRKRIVYKQDLFNPSQDNAHFPTGDANLSKFLGENLVYPQAAREAHIEGKVLLTFVVEDDGTIDEVEVISSPSDLLSQEAIRVMLAMPKWKPAEQNHVKVAVSFTIPINFKLSAPN